MRPRSPSFGGAAFCFLNGTQDSKPRNCRRDLPRAPSPDHAGAAVRADRRLQPLPQPGQALASGGHRPPARAARRDGSGGRRGVWMAGSRPGPWLPRDGARRAIYDQRGCAARSAGGLLGLNHQRYAEEVAAGLHEKGKVKVKAEVAEVKEEMKSPKPKWRKASKDDGGALPLF
jgi:hypothetical protein